MHEFSIANSLIEQVLALAEQNHAEKVNTIELEAGAMRQIVPDIMNTAWESVALDTVAEGSKIKIKEIPIKAKCRKCHLEFQPLLDNYLCPDCKVADVEILQGDQIVLKSIDMET